MASILILGAYGFIGSEVTRACLSNGHDVHAFGRDADALARLGAFKIWCRNLNDMTSARDWTDLLAGIDIVINASGVLQDGPQDDVARVQHDAIAAMAKAAHEAGVGRVVQVSAAGAALNADTPFMASKAAADQVLLDGPVDAIVLRPGLVLGKSVYGGTALLRMLAAVPLIQPIAFPKAPIHVISMEDLISAIRRAVDGTLPANTAIDLVATEPVELHKVVSALRNWLGFPTARLTLVMPPLFSAAVSKVADALGWLGWRSPLRSTSMTVLARGVIGDPTEWQRAGGAPMQNLSEVLHATPSTLQDRMQARMSMMMPLVIAILSVFWLLSGAIGWFSFDEAKRILIYRGFSDELARYFVAAGICADVALGFGVLFKRWARTAMFGMIVVSLGYLLAGSLWTPDLWADPLGPFVKVLPSIILAAVGAFMLDDR